MRDNVVRLDDRRGFQLPVRWNDVLAPARQLGATGK